MSQWDGPSLPLRERKISAEQPRSSMESPGEVWSEAMSLTSMFCVCLCVSVFWKKGWVPATWRFSLNESCAALRLFWAVILSLRRMLPVFLTQPLLEQPSLTCQGALPPHTARSRTTTVIFQGHGPCVSQVAWTWGWSRSFSDWLSLELPNLGIWQCWENLLFSKPVYSFYQSSKFASLRRQT